MHAWVLCMFVHCVCMCACVCVRAMGNRLERYYRVIRSQLMNSFTHSQFPFYGKCETIIEFSNKTRIYKFKDKKKLIDVLDKLELYLL